MILTTENMAKKQIHSSMNTQKSITYECVTVIKDKINNPVHEKEGKIEG